MVSALNTTRNVTQGKLSIVPFHYTFFFLCLVVGEGTVQFTYLSSPAIATAPAPSSMCAEGSDCFEHRGLTLLIVKDEDIAS